MVKIMAEYEELAPRFKEALMKWQKTENPFSQAAKRRGNRRRGKNCSQGDDDGNW